jgi:hypothetical protein
VIFTNEEGRATSFGTGSRRNLLFRVPPLEEAIRTLKVQAPDLDLSLLEAWAAALDLRETWRRVLADAELQGV